MFNSGQSAAGWLERGGWDYFVTVQHSDTADEVEHWVRHDDDLRLEDVFDHA